MIRTRVLFVCLGNICRSPLAEGVFRALVDEAGAASSIEADSAGTADWHAGKPPDRRVIAAARARGIDISGQRSRPVAAGDFDAFDLMLAMDAGNRRELLALAPPRRAARVRLFLDYAPGLGPGEVPDPFYGGAEDFERVLDLVEAASRGLLAALRDGRM